MSPILWMLQGKQSCLCAIWFYLIACIWALYMKQREAFQQSRNLAFAKHSILSASWIPEKLIETWFRMTPVSLWCLQLNFAITIQDGLWNQRRGTIKLLLGAFPLAANCRTLFYSLCLFDIRHMLLCGCLPAKTVLICPVSFLSAYGLCLCIYR